MGDLYSCVSGKKGRWGGAAERHAGILSFWLDRLRNTCFTVPNCAPLKRMGSIEGFKECRNR